MKTHEIIIAVDTPEAENFAAPLIRESRNTGG